MAKLYQRQNVLTSSITRKIRYRTSTSVTEIAVLTWDDFPYLVPSITEKDIVSIVSGFPLFASTMLVHWNSTPVNAP